MKSDTQYRTGDELKFVRGLLKKDPKRFISYARMVLGDQRSWDGTRVNVKRLKNRLRDMLKELGIEETRNRAA